MPFRALGAAAVSLAPRALAYSEMFGYMPVSDVTEHAAIIADVTLMFEKLGTSSLEAGGIYAQAKCIYESGGGNSCKSASTPRTLQGFATKDLTGETYADKFYASGWAINFWDIRISAALDGTGTYAGLSDTKRVTSIKKATMGLLTYYASHELEAAIDKAAVADTRSDAASGHAWDEGWAFYRGPAEDGGDTPWEVAGKRDSNFPDGTVVATAIVPYFNAGLIAVRSATYDATAAEYARDVIYKMWAITYLRAALKYLEISETTYGDKAHAEGYAYWMAIDGWWNSYDSASATSMREALDITKTSIASGTFCATKALMEAAYPSVGIDCGMVGTFEDSTITCSGTTTESISVDSTTDSATTGTCSAPTVTFNAGASMVAALDDVAGSDITCASYLCQSAPASTDASAAISPVADAALVGLAALALAAFQAS
jgi:hypothetical protein